MNKRDIQLIGIIIVLAIGGLVASRVMLQSDSIESYVNIYVEGSEYERVTLNETQVVTIDVEGKYNEIKINTDGVVMQKASCSNQDCLEQGEVTLDNINTRPLGGWIICLPNHVSVELVKGADK
ncbi:hypothetical protein SAMN05660297_02153 [Natronincola peptidivorans]|uniref:Uncharacterized protein n=1 Tax=Natronincola peptidivorans TaxID=426128 RepID=A0A1I0DRE5_9FIRM|nr:NusG domain II-containing protein [Natronincola peptidivorans]SET35140.1 hypothetical protein SAMN05660297_02153 [Natronincola peptidivorans]